MNKETLKEQMYKASFANESPLWHDGFMEGAKWQSERSYSEEEVIELLEYTRENFYDIGTKWHSEPDTDYTSKELFEQFKKK